MGRPKKYTKKRIKEIGRLLEDYRIQTEIPIIAEFAYLNNIPRQTLYTFGEEFSDTIKRCIDKKEAQLERLALSGDIKTTMAIFSLKQLGWKDKQEVTLGGELPIKIEYIQKPKGAGETKSGTG